MSNMEAVYATEFSALVKHAYQSKGFLLKDTIQYKKDITGNNKVKFTYSGYGVAKQYPGPGQIIDPMNSTVEPIELVLEDSAALEYIWEFDLAKIQHDEKTRVATVVSNALGRNNTQKIINALGVSKPRKPSIIDYTSKTVGYGLVGETNEYFESVPIKMMSEKLTFLISPFFQRKLLEDTDFASSDFTRGYWREKGTLNGMSYSGFNFIVIPDMPEGGLPKTGNVRTCYAYASDSVGYAEGIKFNTKIQEDIKIAGLAHRGIMSSNAVIIDGAGVQEIQITEE